MYRMATELDQKDPHADKRSRYLWKVSGWTLCGCVTACGGGLPVSIVLHLSLATHIHTVALCLLNGVHAMESQGKRRLGEYLQQQQHHQHRSGAADADGDEDMQQATGRGKRSRRRRNRRGGDAGDEEMADANEQQQALQQQQQQQHSAAVHGDAAAPVDAAALRPSAADDLAWDEVPQEDGDGLTGQQCADEDDTHEYYGDAGGADDVADAGEGVGDAAATQGDD